MTMMRLYKNIVSLLTVVVAVVLFCSCDGADPIIVTPDGGYSSKPRVTLDDSESGTFTVENLSSGEMLTLKDDVVTATNPIADCYAGDTLKIVFTRKDVYKDKTFTVDCPQLTKIGDSLYIVPNYTNDVTEHVSTLSMSLQAKYLKSTSDSIYKLTAQNDCYITYRSYFYFELKYVLTMSDDLLRYVKPEVTFTDLDGQVQKKVLTANDFSDKSNHILVYKDAEGNIHEIQNNERQPQDDWTFVRDYYIALSPVFEALTGFIKRDMDLTATVRYLPAEGEELTEDHCNFERALTWSATGYNADGIYEAIGNVGSEKLTKAREYLQRLYATTDVIRLGINKRGEIREK